VPKVPLAVGAPWQDATAAVGEGVAGPEGAVGEGEAERDGATATTSGDLFIEIARLRPMANTAQTSPAVQKMSAADSGRGALAAVRSASGAGRSCQPCFLPPPAPTVPYEALPAGAAKPGLGPRPLMNGAAIRRPTSLP
jgi:hypothetical protein